MPRTRLNRRAFGKVAFASTVPLFASTSSAASGVTVPEDYDTIQEAVNQAEPGETIQVESGTYHEQVTINKPVTILGDPGDDTAGVGSEAPVIEGEHRPDGVAFQVNHIDSGRVVIRGFEITRFGDRAREENSGTGIKSSTPIPEVIVTDCHIHNISGSGVAVFDGGEAEISEWKIRRNLIEDFDSDGVRLDYLSETVVENNEIRGTGDAFMGIRVSAAMTGDFDGIQSGVEVRDNTVKGSFESPGIRVIAINRRGIEGDQGARSKNITVEGNELTINNRTIAIQVSANSANGPTAINESTTVRENTVNEAFIGMLINSYQEGYVKDVSIAENKVKNATYGIALFGPNKYLNNITITKNIVTKNETAGIAIFNAASTANLSNNTIKGNSGWGVLNRSDEELDATDNYWGHASGPGGKDGRTNPAGKVIGRGDTISGNVKFDPWLRQPET